MRQLNSLIVIGRLAADPEPVKSRRGEAGMRFTVLNTQGEDTVPVDCYTWGKLADIVDEYVPKGTLVSITGTLRNDTFEGQDGRHRWYFCAVDTLNILESKSVIENRQANRNGESSYDRNRHNNDDRHGNRDAQNDRGDRRQNSRNDSRGDSRGGTRYGEGRRYEEDDEYPSRDNRRNQNDRQDNRSQAPRNERHDGQTAGQPSSGQPNNRHGMRSAAPLNNQPLRGEQSHDEDETDDPFEETPRAAPQRGRQ